MNQNMDDSSGAMAKEIEKEEDQRILMKLIETANQDPEAWIMTDEYKLRHGVEEFENYRLRILNQAMQDEEGRGIIGQDMLLQARDLIDYTGLARKSLRVQPLRIGEMYTLAKDVRRTAYVLERHEGQPAVGARTYGHQIVIPEHRMMIILRPPSELKPGTIEELSQQGYHDLLRGEDEALMMLLDRASEDLNTVTCADGEKSRVRGLDMAMEQIRLRRLMPDRIIVRRDEVKDWKRALGEQFDPCNQRELNASGFHGRYCGAMIISEAKDCPLVVPSGRAYVTAAPEYVGEMSIRLSYFSEPFTETRTEATFDGEFTEQHHGWAWIGVLGMAIANTAAVSKLLLV